MVSQAEDEPIWPEEHSFEPNPLFNLSALTPNSYISLLNGRTRHQAKNI